MRYLRKGNAVSTVLNILGMTAAFAALYIILVQVHHDLSYNRGIKDSERIYVMTLPDWYEEGHYMLWLNRPVQEAIIGNLSSVEAGGTGYLFGQDADVFREEGADRMTAKLSAFSKGALDVFGFDLVEGSFEDLKTSGQIAVSESFAARSGLTVGSSFKLRMGGGDKDEKAVVAVYKDMPEASDLASFDMFMLMGDESLESEWSYPYYVKLSSSRDKDVFEKQASAMAVKYYRDKAAKAGGAISDEDDGENQKALRYHLVNIRDTYFDPLLGDSASAKGNRSTTMTLLSIAILVLAISFINYLNFFFAMVPMTIKSLNTRKVLGASRSSLVLGSVLESVAMIVISLAFAAVVVCCFQASHLASLISCSTAFGANLGVALSTAGLAMVISVIASLYPSFYVSSIPPALSLKGSFGATSKGKGLRYTLIGLQFVISIALIICAIFVNLQRSYMLNHEMGFDKERLLTLETSYTVADRRAEVDARLLTNPQIVDIAWASGSFIADNRMGWRRTIHDELRSWQCYPVSWNFLHFMGIPIVEGRDFQRSDEESEKGVFIFNQTAKDGFGITLEDRVAGHKGETEIAGFCKDFNFSSLRSKVSPFCFYIFGKEVWKPLTTLFVRTAPGADAKQLFSFISSTLAQYDGEHSADDFDIKFFDDTLQSSYAKEKKLSSLITLFTILAVIISLMGVFGLVLFETEYRRKEIGVRRVNGATVSEILKIFNTKFVRTVLVCFVIAAPVSWWITNRYLQSFAYRISLYAWVFVLALLAVLAVTIAVVTLRSLHAATANPVESLKSE